MWLMAQMKAYSMLMKNWALICGLGHLCKKILKLWMCGRLTRRRKLQFRSFVSKYYLRLKMVIPCPRIQRIIHLENFWQGQKILWELSFSTVYRLWHYDHSFLVKFALLSQNPWEKKRRVSISLSEILFLHWFCVKSQQSLFTFQSFCIILVKSFLQELSNLCQSAIWINKKVNKLSQNISNSRKGITIFERR